MKNTNIEIKRLNVSSNIINKMSKNFALQYFIAKLTNTGRQTEGNKSYLRVRAPPTHTYTDNKQENGFQHRDKYQNGINFFTEIYFLAEIYKRF